MLILGSMPGQASLDLQQYYAYPRNLFWPLLADALVNELPGDYQTRLDWAKKNGVALWDVLKHCKREGSLDAKIERKSEVANDLAELIRTLPKLNTIALNGKKAEQVFKRYIASSIEDFELNVVVLPSSSPANASIPIEVKREQWCAAIRGALC